MTSSGNTSDIFFQKYNIHGQLNAYKLNFYLFFLNTPVDQISKSIDCV